MRHENYHESDFVVLYGKRCLYARSAGRCDAAIDGAEPNPNAFDENSSTVPFAVPTSLGLRDERFTAPHSKAGTWTFFFFFYNLLGDTNADVNT